jgi:hypothetical protein
MTPASFTSSEAAMSGFFAIILTFSIMRSSGSSTRFYASCVKKIDERLRMRITKEVRQMLMILSTVV